MTDLVDPMARAGFDWQVARNGLKLRWEDALAEPLHDFWNELAWWVGYVWMNEHQDMTKATAVAAEMAHRVVAYQHGHSRHDTLRDGFLAWEQLPEHCRQYFRDLAAAMMVAASWGKGPSHP